ncbi:MAG: DNA glycosylase AlkZ-like family protein, partial [Candidatus Thorarchaeota archaeon]
TDPLTDEEAADFIVDTTLGSHGIGCYDDIRTYHNKLPSQKIWKGRKDQIESYLEQRVKEGHLEEVKVKGLKERYFILTKNVDMLKADSFVDLDNAPVKLLTPFDNIIRERAFPKRIWEFDYKIECYVPAPDRIFGYFVLPILDKDELAGRLDAKVHRKEGLLEIKALYLESKEIQSSDGLERLNHGILEFAKFHNCDSISLTKVRPRKLTTKVRSLISK